MVFFKILGVATVVTLIVSGGRKPTVRPTESTIVSIDRTKAAAMAITAFVLKAMKKSLKI